MIERMRIDWEIYLFGLLVATAICKERRDNFVALLASLKMKMVWESDVAGCGWRWINLIWVKVNDLWVKVDDLSIKVWIVRVEGAAKEQGELEKDGWSLDTSVKKNNVFFFIIYL
jgi:hypothetical protein